MSDKFLWGGASASYQCEGAWNLDDKAESMWDHYLHEEGLENGDIASDHYHRFEEDIRMMKEGGQNAYRFSLSWPRIIKNKAGEINEKGIAFYHRLLDACHTYGIEPFVTLYHWDLPQYWEDCGGWQNEEVCEAFETYASALGVRAFRQGKYPGTIGIVHSFTPVNGVDDTVNTRIAMRYADNYCNNWILDTAAKGEIPVDLLSELSKTYDLSMIKPAQLQIIKDYTVDFLGLNYYSRTLVKPYTEGETTFIVNNSGKQGKGSSKVIVKGWFEQVMHDPASTYTEWDTEIYPKGLKDGLLEVKKKYNLPVYITENGIGMYEDVTVKQVEDDYRISFMKDHLQAMHEAMEAGADVRGYFAWSSFDLYSWKNGCEKRYGLVAVDFENGLQRKPKKSYYWFKNMIEQQKS